MSSEPLNLEQANLDTRQLCERNPIDTIRFSALVGESSSQQGAVKLDLNRLKPGMFVLNRSRARKGKPKKSIPRELMLETMKGGQKRSSKYQPVYAHSLIREKDGLKVFVLTDPDQPDLIIRVEVEVCISRFLGLDNSAMDTLTQSQVEAAIRAITVEMFPTLTMVERFFRSTIPLSSPTSFPSWSTFFPFALVRLDLAVDFWAISEFAYLVLRDTESPSFRGIPKEKEYERNGWKLALGAKGLSFTYYDKTKETDKRKRQNEKARSESKTSDRKEAQDHILTDEDRPEESSAEHYSSDMAQRNQIRAEMRAVGTQGIQRLQERVTCVVEATSTLACVIRRAGRFEIQPLPLSFVLLHSILCDEIKKQCSAAIPIEMPAPKLASDLGIYVAALCPPLEDLLRQGAKRTTFDNVRREVKEVRKRLKTAPIPNICYSPNQIAEIEALKAATPPDWKRYQRPRKRLSNITKAIKEAQMELARRKHLSERRSSFKNSTPR